MPVSFTDRARWRGRVADRIYITDVEPGVTVLNGMTRVLSGSAARALLEGIARGATVSVGGSIVMAVLSASGSLTSTAQGRSRAVAILSSTSDGDMTTIVYSGSLAEAVLTAIGSLQSHGRGSSQAAAIIGGVGAVVTESVGATAGWATIVALGALVSGAQGRSATQAGVSGIGALGSTAAGRSSAVAVLSSSGEFLPTDIAGLKLWLKADAITGLSDGDPVATWSDSSGQGVTVSQGTTSKRPTYKTSVVNGLPTVRFDGSDDYLTAALSVADGSKTVFVVFADNSTDSSGRYFLDSETGRLIIVERSFNGTGPYNQLAWYDGAWRDIAALTSGWHHYCWRLDASGASGALFRDGTSLGSASYSSKAIGGNVAIGSAYDGGGAYIGGDMAEMLIYDTALSTTDRQSVETYLATKYGL